MLPVAFDPHWRIAPGAWLRASTLRQLTAALAAVETRDRRRRPDDATRYALAVECLLANVVAAHLTAPDCALAVRRDRHRDSVDPVVYGSHLATAVDAAERCGLVIPGRHGVYSTVEPTAQFLAMLPRPLPWSVLQQSRDQPALLLRGVKNALGRATVLPFDSTPETTSMATDMATLNAWFRKLPAKRSGAQEWLTTTKDGRLLRVATMKHTHCLRIFNNATFDHGGRLYHCWWLALTKAERFETVTLASEPVAEVDYRGQYLRLAYRAVRAAWPFAPDADGYADDSDPRREGMKACTLALLNGARGQQLPRDVLDKRLFPVGTKAATVYGSIRARHPALQRAGAFGSTLGHTLARADSDLMVKLLLRLKGEGIPALPIHDAVCVPRSRAQPVAVVMQDLAQELLGCELPATVRYGLERTGTVAA